MNALLASLECAVTCAASGEEAVELALRTSFDLVLIDLHMPGIAGDEAPRRLRAKGRSRAAFVTQWSTDPMGRLDQGLYDTRLAKPLVLDELEAIVAEVRRRQVGRADAAAHLHAHHRQTDLT